MAERLLTAFELPEAPPRKSSEYLTAYHKWSYAAIKFIAQTFAGIELKLYRKKGTGKNMRVDEVDEHDALALLQGVNRYTTFNQLKQLYIIHMYLLGEAAWVLIRDKSKLPVEIWPLRPDWLKVVPSRENFIDHYEYQPNGGMKSVDLKPEEIIFFKDLSPTSMYRGYSHIRAAAYPIDIDEFSDEYNRNFFFNGGMPGMILGTKSKMSPDAKQRFIEAWQNKFGGRGNSHKVALIDGTEIQVEKISSNEREMDFNESKKSLRDEILAMFGVSTANLGITESSNRAVQEATDARFMKHVIVPQLTMFVEFLNEFLLPMFDTSGELFFNYENPVPEDIEAKLSKYNSALQHGWMTINEVREEEGLLPLDGGDVLMVNGSLVPLTETQEPPAPEQPAPSEEEDLQEESEEDEPAQPRSASAPKHKQKQQKINLVAPIPRASLAKRRENRLRTSIATGLKGVISAMMEKQDGSEDNSQRVLYTLVEREKIWKAVTQRTDIQEDIMSAVINTLAREQSKQVLARLESNKNNLKSTAIRHKISASNIYFDIMKETARWRKKLQPLIARIVKEQGNRVLHDLGLRDDFNMSAEPVREYITGISMGFVRDVNMTTRKELTSVINTGIRNGDSIDQIARAIEKVYDKFPKYRSRRIARTTVIGNNNFANDEAYGQSGVVEGKEWLTARDERVRHTHNGAEGQVVRLGESFKVGGRKMKYPGDPNAPAKEIVNCRCTTVPVLTGLKHIDYIAEKRKELEIDQTIHAIKEKVLAGKAERLGTAAKKQKVTAKEITKRQEILKKEADLTKVEKKIRSDKITV